jgi:peptide/nickel transport system substrate-binding protein
MIHGSIQALVAQFREWSRPALIRVPTQFQSEGEEFMAQHRSDGSSVETVQTLTRLVTRGRLTRREALLRGAALGLSAPAMLALSGATSPRSAFAQDASPVPVSGGTLKVGLQADPAELDPALTQLTAAWHIIEHVYESLLTYDASLQPVPQLAESYDISADGLTYTFNLRSGVTWHNGRPFVADDVKYSVDRTLDPATASPNSTEYDSVASVEAPDDATVVFVLKSPDSSFLSKLMGNAGFVFPREAVEENGDLNQVMVGTGPFKFVDYTPQTELNLVKNDAYWDPGKPYLDGIQFLIASEDTSRTTALTSGTVDFIEYAPVKDLPIFEGDDSIQVAGDQNTNIRYLAMNVSRDPLSILEVRQAISKVVDRGPIIDSAVFGAGTPTAAIFPSSFWAGGEYPIEAQDIEGAKALLATAGHPDGFQTTISSWQAYSFLSNAAVVLQEQLRQVGIEAELNLQENATYLADYFAGNFDLSVTGTSGHIDPNDVIHQNFGTGESNNGTQYSNPEVDGLIAQGIAVTDQAERAAIYNQIQAILLQDLPWVNLFIANQYEAMKTYVKGYIHIPTGTNRSFREVWLDQQ